MDVVVQSSRQEVMAQTTLEAMAAGRAVVSTATMGADEAIEDGVTGALVDVGDAEAMARAMTTLASDPDRRATMGRAARRRIESQFTMAHVLEDRAEDILGRVAAGRPAGSP